MLNVFPSSLEAEDRREGLRRFREREAVRLRNEQAAQEFLARPGLTGLVNDNIPRCMELLKGSGRNSQF
jgi:hypothetical protein